MSPERFIQMTQAYGASPTRWPLAERDAAQALLSGDGAEADIARHALADACSLDEALSAYLVVAPDAALVAKVLADAPSLPAPHTRTPWRRWPWRHPRFWLSGVGLLGVGAVGVASGVVMMSLLFSAAPAAMQAGPDHAYAGTVFSDAAADWSDE